MINYIEKTYKDSASTIRRSKLLLSLSVMLIFVLLSAPFVSADDELKLPPVADKDAKSSPSTHTAPDDVQPMSFEQAVAAGLVPAEILQREDDL